MNFIGTLFSIGLIVGCNTALAAEAGKPNGADPTNPFSGAAIIGRARTPIIIAGEDLSNPFSDVHPIEQGR
jgi:hypothetical protein